MGSSFAAGLMASLLYSASKERVGLGVALLAFVGLLRHAEPDSLDAEVNVEAPGGRLCVCVRVHVSICALQLSSGLCGLALHEGFLSARVSRLVGLHCSLAWLATALPVPCSPSLL